MRWLLVIALVALVVRVVYVLVVLREYGPVSDALHYHSIAAAIAEGRGVVHPFPFDFVHPTAWRPPLYPLVLGAVYAVTGPRLGAAEALNVALGTSVVVLAVVLSWRLAGWWAALATGVLVAVYPPLIFNDGPPLSEPLGLVLLLATLLLVIDRRVLGAGVASGLLLLTRPSGQFFVVALAGWVLWRLGWRRALAYVLVVGVVVAPWMLRNWIRLGSPVIVTSNGFNLNAVYSPEAKAAGGFVDGVFDPRFATLRAGITNEVKLDAALRRHALASIREDPSQVFEVAAHNALGMFELRPSYNTAPEALDGRNLRVRRLSLPLVWLVLPSGLIGMWAMRRRPGTGPLVLAAVVFPAVSLVSVAPPRLRAPLDLVCCIAVGGLAAEVVRARAARRRR